MGTSAAAGEANAGVSAQKRQKSFNSRVSMESVLRGFIGHGAGELKGAHQQVALAANRVGRLSAEAAGLDPVRTLDRQRPLLQRVHRAARVAERAEDAIRPLHDHGEVHTDRARRPARMNAVDAEYEQQVGRTGGNPLEEQANAGWLVPRLAFTMGAAV